jgi:uncharacterized membrane protein YbaN (DUF454 family)
VTLLPEFLKRILNLWCYHTLSFTQKKCACCEISNFYESQNIIFCGLCIQKYVQVQFLWLWWWYITLNFTRLLDLVYNFLFRKRTQSFRNWILSHPWVKGCRANFRIRFDTEKYSEFLDNWCQLTTSTYATWIMVCPRMRIKNIIMARLVNA